MYNLWFKLKKKDYVSNMIRKIIAQFHTRVLVVNF